MRSFFADGTTLDLRADIGQMSIGLEAFGPGTVTGYRRLMEQSARLHRVSDRFFFWRPVGGLRDMVKVKGAFEPSLLLDLLALQPGRSMAAMVRSHVPDGRVAQMLDDFTQYVGSAPDTSPAVLCGIAHMQTNEGVWYPAGGIAAVPRALTRLASELGVEIRTQTGVRRILQAGKGCACGLETEAGERIPLDAVVSNSDAVRTHRELLGGNEAVRFDRRRTYEPACSGVVLYLGLDRRYDHLLHHNFVFSSDPKAEFEAIYGRGEPAPDRDGSQRTHSIVTARPAASLLKNTFRRAHSALHDKKTSELELRYQKPAYALRLRPPWWRGARHRLFASLHDM